MNKQPTPDIDRIVEDGAKPIGHPSKGQDFIKVGDIVYQRNDLAQKRFEQIRAEERNRIVEWVKDPKNNTGVDQQGRRWIDAADLLTYLDNKDI